MPPSDINGSCESREYVMFLVACYDWYGRVGRGWPFTQRLVEIAQHAQGAAKKQYTTTIF